MKSQRFLCIAAVFTGVVWASSAYAVAIEETDSQKFVRITRTLEIDPFLDSDKQLRSWMISWASDSEDVQIKICGIFGPLLDLDYEYGGELLTQSMFGNAAYQIEHPHQQADEFTLQMAGMDSLLKSYGAVIAVHPQANIPYFDDLLQKQQDGSLPQFMAPLIAEHCIEEAN